MPAAQRSFSTGMDTARVGASFMVVLLHVAAVNFSAFGEQWWASNFYDSLTRSCVPIFLMITGVLLLGKQESMPVFFKKRFTRVLPPLLFWSLFYMAWNTMQGEEYGPWYGWATALLNGPVTFHLWYLYAIVGIYLFVPFLRNIWNATGPGEKKMFLALWILVSALPTLQEALGIDTDLLTVYGVDGFVGLVGYLFLGAYVHEVYKGRVDKRRYWLNSLALFMVFSVLTMVATNLYSRHNGAPDALFYDYLSPLVVASAVCAFNVLYGAGTKMPHHNVPIGQISACTLGVYCLHIFVLNRFEAVTGWMATGTSLWWAIPITAIAVFALSLFATLLLRQFSAFRFVT